MNKDAGIGETGHPKWEEAAKYHIKSLGVPSHVWNSLPTGTDYDNDIRSRPLYANWLNGSVLVSIHNNGGGGSGTEIWYDTTNGYQVESRRLATIVLDKLIHSIRENYDSNWINRGVKGSNGNYGENRLANMPSVIIEIAFMDKKSPDNDALHDESFRQIVADAICQGIEEFLLGGPLLQEQTLVIAPDASGYDKWGNPIKDKVFWFQNSKLYWVTSESVILMMDSLPGWQDYPPANEFNSSKLDGYEGWPDGEPVFIEQNTRSNDMLVVWKVQNGGDNKVYSIQSGKRRHIVTEDAFPDYGYDGDDVISVTQTIENLFAEGNPVYPIGYGASAPQLFRDCYNRVISYEGKGGYELFGMAYNTVHAWGNGVIQDFEKDDFNNSAILQSNNSNTAYAIYGGLWSKYKELAEQENGSIAPPSYLDYPESDEREANQSGASGFDTQGRAQDFKLGHLHYHRTGDHAGQSFETHGAIDDIYVEQYGGSGSWLGFPITDEYNNNLGYPQGKFEGGFITTLNGTDYEAYTSPPSITHREPSPGATGVPVGTNIEITFSSPMDTNATESAFSIIPSVPGAKSWVNYRTLVFNPASDLLPNQQYEIKITTSARDLAHNNLPSEAKWSFTTQSSSPILYVGPTNIDLGTHPAGYDFPNKSFIVRNDGGGTLTGNVSESVPWITYLDPKSFNLTTGQQVTINFSGFFPSTPGPFNTNISVTSNGGNQSVYVHGVVGTPSSTLYVDDDNTTAPWDGTDENPYQYIQDGIDAAVDGNTVIVKDGNYSIHKGPRNVNLDFCGKAITVRSANGASNCIINCGNTEGVRGFYFHNDETQSSVLEGFTIKNGKAADGGGISCQNSSPTIRDNVIEYSYASRYGGGIYCYRSSALISCNIIRHNTAIAGGGIRCEFSDANIIGNEISDNNADSGGGISCSYSEDSQMIAKNKIAGNASNSGGGIYFATSSPEMQNNEIIDNTAKWGGGIGCYDGSSPEIINTTITMNVASDGGGAINCGKGSSPVLVNSILWADSPQEIRFNPQEASNRVTISYSDIQGGEGGIQKNGNGSVDWLAGNINADPKFCSPGDCNLQSGSPCINSGTSAGAPPDDIEGNARDANPDMGAYEFISVNSPPVADADGPYNGQEGSTIEFDGSGSYDPDGTIVSYNWDLDGDGQYDDATGPKPSKLWKDDYTGSIGLKVIDNVGSTDTDTATVTVNNASPVVNAGINQTVNVGDTVSINASFTDPGVLDTHTATIDWGDGSPDEPGTVNETNGSGTVKGSHVYSTAKKYTVTISVKDDDAGEGSDGLVVDVLAVPNLPPVANANGPYTGYVYLPIPFDGTGSYDPDGNIVSYEWDFGDGTSGGGPKPSHIYMQAGTYTVTLTVTDNDGCESNPSDQTTADVVCPFTVLSKDLLVLGKLRQFRDDLLAKNETGQKLIQLYYRHSQEVSGILLKDLSLSLRGAAILKETIPGIYSLLGDSTGEDLLLTPLLVDRIKRLLEDISREGSAELKQTLYTLNDMLNQYEGLQFSQIWQAIEEGGPEDFVVLQNHPNPFNPDTWIPYMLKEDADVTIKIYNEDGYLVRSLNLGRRDAGFYISRRRAAHWDGKNEVGEEVASGIYFCVFQAGDYIATRKMIILR
jgi:hypothetical protein